jgi:AMMECR1 domain-containing protein
LKPDVDGVILRDGIRRATFLPQVWEKLPDPAAFLSHLCQKMGAPSDLWRRKILQVFTYQVEEFEEAKI